MTASAVCSKLLIVSLESLADESGVPEDRPAVDWAAVVADVAVAPEPGEGSAASHVVRKASTALMDATPLRLKESSGTPDDHDVLVLRPGDTDDVCEIVRALAAGRRKFAVAAGLTNVVGALDGAPSTVISTERLNRVLDYDPVSLTVTVGAGMLGGELEEWLDERELTLGQFPQSLHIATVGGWIATRATGSLSARNQGVDAAVVGASVVLADGQLLQFRPRARPAGGLDGLALFLGTEGSLGIVTEVSFRVHRKLPELTVCFSFPGLDPVIEAQRELIQGSYPIALLRGYNAAETAHILGTPAGRPECLLIASTIGPADMVVAQRAAIVETLTALEGTRLRDDAASRWFAERFAVSSMMSDRNGTAGEAFDTIEAFVPWSQASACARDLEQQLSGRTERLYLHFSHAYSTGVGFYLLLWLSAESDEAVVRELRACWDLVLSIAVEHGGTIGHHHGVGAVRSSLYQQSSDGLLHAQIKKALDPNSLLHARLLASS